VLGPFVYHNQFAAFVELVFPLAMVASLRDRGRALIYAGMAGALYASVIASASRAGIALVTLELIAILSIALARRLISAKTAGLVTVCFVAFVVCFGAIVGWQTLWDRMRQPDLYKTRQELLRSSLDMVKERPGMGFGLGTWPTAYPAYAYSDDGLFTNQAHNDWAQWAAEGGLPFFFLMLSIAVWSVRPAVDSLWAIGILAVFLHCLVDYPIQRPALGGLFFVLLGALAAHANESE
jgi:O-antigen ligase